MSVRVDSPPFRGIGLTVAATGGALSGLVYLAILTGVALYQGRGFAAGANAVGAWAVRWLQSAAPQALDNVYPDATIAGIFIALLIGEDATIAGIFIALLIGALTGAVLASLLARLPDDHPLAWGLLMGLVLWWLVLRSLAPALDPVLLTLVGGRELFLAHLVSGAVLGVWLNAARQT